MNIVELPDRAGEWVAYAIDAAGRWVEVSTGTEGCYLYRANEYWAKGPCAEVMDLALRLVAGG